ncbi:hypothetical protein [Maricaulis sp.]|uniref:hypothetical protein n=1 Tax=Maricaulis sp. TaxID=1486257 RepID=UPI0025B85507|nr:hypothetical protein [Maricaulis sp.]
MNTPDPLAGFFAADTPPAMDRVFRTAVMERVARRRFQIELALRCVATLCLLAGLALVAPVLQRLAGLLGRDLSEVLVILALSGGIAFIGHAWLTRAASFEWPRLRLF